MKGKFYSEERNVKVSLGLEKAYQEGRRFYKNKKMSNSERALSRLLNKLFPKEYKYVGNGLVYFEGRNPDFINVNGKKKLIEISSHSHIRKFDRINYFRKFGFETLFIWNRELKNLKKLKRKISEFHKSEDHQVSGMTHSIS